MLKLNKSDVNYYKIRYSQHEVNDINIGELSSSYREEVLNLLEYNNLTNIKLKLEYDTNTYFRNVIDFVLKNNDIFDNSKSLFLFIQCLSYVNSNIDKILKEYEYKNNVTSDIDVFNNIILSQIDSLTTYYKNNSFINNQHHYVLELLTVLNHLYININVELPNNSLVLYDLYINDLSRFSGTNYEVLIQNNTELNNFKKSFVKNAKQNIKLNDSIELLNDTIKSNTDKYFIIIDETYYNQISDSKIKDLMSNNDVIYHLILSKSTYTHLNKINQIVVIDNDDTYLFYNKLFSNPLNVLFETKFDKQKQIGLQLNAFYIKSDDLYHNMIDCVNIDNSYRNQNVKCIDLEKLNKNNKTNITNKQSYSEIYETLNSLLFTNTSNEIRSLELLNLICYNQELNREKLVPLSVFNELELKIIKDYTEEIQKETNQNKVRIEDEYCSYTNFLDEIKLSDYTYKIYNYEKILDLNEYCNSFISKPKSKTKIIKEINNKSFINKDTLLEIFNSYYQTQNNNSNV